MGGLTRAPQTGAQASIETLDPATPLLRVRSFRCCSSRASPPPPRSRIDLGCGRLACLRAHRQCAAARPDRARSSSWHPSSDVRRMIVVPGAGQIVDSLTNHAPPRHRLTVMRGYALAFVSSAA